MTDTPQSAKPEATPTQSPTQSWWSETLKNRRRLGTVAAICVTLVLAWHVVNGRNGLTSWQQKRTEDKALTQELDQLTQENAHLRDHVDRLKSDPGAIEFEARERLHYARPNEVIYALPEAPQKTAPAPH
jgi:cell division protein FtsB